MSDKKTISGFSKLSKRGKIKWLAENFFKDREAVKRELISYWHSNEDQQKILDGFSENTISNFPMPFGIAPNFVINDKTYCVPMVTEESSVVAAASSAAKFWMHKGGFKAEVVSTQKIGQVHFYWHGEYAKLEKNFEELKVRLIADAKEITHNMDNRGGGIREIELKSFDEEADYYQLFVTFETCDSMGANFINSVLESFAQSLKDYLYAHPDLEDHERDVNVIMSILSNYTPQCLVKVWVECAVEDLQDASGELSGQEFADKFVKAVKVAHLDPYRAVTHNKGIFNGIDAVVLATGNDFRAIEACGHSYAAQDGQYRSLSNAHVADGKFKFWMDLPLAVGTVGGLTSLHPMAKRSIELLDKPNAQELMQIIAVTGLAQNFAALRSLTTTGIQKGHMKMHLMNILNHLEANDGETEKVKAHFEDKNISFSAVRNYLASLRNGLIRLT